jgi:hypothetical protein
LLLFSVLAWAAVVCSRPNRATNSTEIDLRPASTCPKLDPTSVELSAERPAQLAESLTRAALSSDMATSLPELPPSEELLRREDEPELAANEVPPSPVAIYDWRDLETLRTPHRGESPMMATWRRINQHLLLAAALTAASPAFAEPPVEPSRDEVIDKKFDDLKGMLETLTKEIRALQGEALSSTTRTAKLENQIEELKDKIARMQRDLDGLKANRTAFSPPDPEPRTGRLRLVNAYYEPVTVVVNGRAYTLAASETRYIDSVAAGTFTYEVLGIQAQRSRGLAPNETFTITVYPR